MSTTLAEFRARLQSLVDTFKANADEYLAVRRAETRIVVAPAPECAPTKYRLG